jgi:hypothetical protein
MKRLSLLILVAALMVLPGFAQITTPTQQVALSYNAVESITLTLSTNNVSLQQLPAYAPLTATVTYNFAQPRTLNMAAYFSAPASALSAGTLLIPASDVISYQTGAGSAAGAVPCVQGQVGTGVAAVGVTGATCYNFLIAPVGAGFGTLQATEELALANNNYPAGTYTGTLNVAVAAQ